MLCMCVCICDYIFIHVCVCVCVCFHVCVCVCVDSCRANWAFEVDTFDSSRFRWVKGGFQGGRGNKEGAEWYDVYGHIYTHIYIYIHVHIHINTHTNIHTHQRSRIPVSHECECE